MDNELKKIWQSATAEEQIKFEKSRLIIELGTSLKSLDTTLRYRDWGEIIAAIIVMIVFTFYAFTIPFIITKIASVLIVFWAVFVMYYLREAKKDAPKDETGNYLEYLESTKVYLTKQKALLENILWWYVGPAFFCYVLFLLGFYEDEGKRQWIMDCLIIGFIGAVVIYFMNIRAADKTYTDKISKVEDLIALMKADKE